MRFRARSQGESKLIFFQSGQVCVSILFVSVSIGARLKNDFLAFGKRPADKDIVSGMYIQRIPDTHTLEIYMVDPTGGIINIPHDLIKMHNGLVEIAACGFGCCLVKSDVFRKIEYPHFYYQSINH